VTTWPAIVALSVALGQQPSDHTLTYYNARMALREGQPLESVKLWLLRNALESETGRVSAHDDDFRSVTWAALGELGVCPDGFPDDRDGAGLWPVALHNWVVRNMSRRARPKRPRVFDAFALGRQQRLFSIDDVLSAQELRTIRLSRTGCLRHRVALVRAGELPTAKIADRQVAARLLLYLLERSRETLDGSVVSGQSVIEARLFDIRLQLIALAEREARQDARERARRGRDIGMSRESVTAMRDDVPTFSFSDDSEPARILRAAVEWPVSEWMALSPERRLFLFDSAREYLDSPPELDTIALGIADLLIDASDGPGAEAWIARSVAGADPLIWSGSRGARLLALDVDSGFRDRAVIALFRGVSHLERGALSDALRALAYAIQHAPESREADRVLALSRRWLSYVASQFAITDDLLVTLKELLPRRDYSSILEDLMWRAAFRADQASFERGFLGQSGRGALERRVDTLRPLAAGDVGRFTRIIRNGLVDSPSETLRFLGQLVERLELEDADVRAAHRPTLEQLQRLLAPMARGEDGSSSRARTAGRLAERCQAILEGLGGLGPDASALDRARSLDPTGEVYAGSVRLAPSDPLPWPFSIEEVPAPSIFSPIDLIPREKTVDDTLIFAWDIGG
jgi:hypothetical protein